MIIILFHPFSIILKSNALLQRSLEFAILKEKEWDLIKPKEEEEEEEEEAPAEGGEAAAATTGGDDGDEE